jgi:chaperonin GroES
MRSACSHDTKLTSTQSAIKSIRSIAPLLDRILVQRIKPETKTATGIFLPDSAVKELNEAKVLAVGPGAFDRDGKRVAPSVQPGDKVLIPQVRRLHPKLPQSEGEAKAERRDDENHQTTSTRHRLCCRTVNHLSGLMRPLCQTRTAHT